MVKRIELRVHAGAPSGRYDDEQYRILADAYFSHNGWTKVQSPLAFPTGPDKTHDNGTAADTSLLMTGHGEQVARYDETTYLGDTQLAYNALESQLLTSSLNVEQEKTPSRTTHFLEAESPWPDDLARHSPEPVPRQTANDLISEVTSSPPPQAEDERPAPRRVNSGIFKPFKLPLKRQSVENVDGQPSSKAVGLTRERRFRTPSMNGESQSSYLKTPILVTPITKQHHCGHESVDVELTPAKTIARIPTSEDTNNGNQHVVSRDFAMPDYREQTPKQKLPIPYATLLEGDEMGLAYIGRAGIDVPQRSQGSASGQETTSELPTSYSLSDMSSKSSRARLRNSQRSTSDPGPLSAADAVSQSAASARSASQPEQQMTADLAHIAKLDPGKFTTHRQQLNTRTGTVAKPATTSNASLATAKSTGEGPAKLQTVEQEIQVAEPERLVADPATASIFQNLPTRIRPPEPVTGLAKFETHVTAPLGYLANSPTMANSYRPVSVQRELRPLERGYWLIPAPAWSVAEQEHFWQYLTTFVGSGQAGWGVWAVREPPLSAIANATFGCVKVYCWGEVARHIYLLLYVASESKVRKLGLQWTDSEEVVVIKMRGPVLKV